ncbi:CDP-glycerol glycerophosphotransferase family protein [Galbitalea sp. SE-J8]|uniref:CDP-glycerol glycerophosphotransferase family protein n=1 Tax=Galbitalea sp. SE-J8 TaxID=3054952 RepID=UPI00259D295B|nr:CDP-glycerol glycerophosphotransferase family protein [Galbitalea sp. SE-J8]MDM4762309.1 CDP-glycerol glycerophosphotransferase family protein [Galbitalea sp. SE-J8]
MRALPLFRPGRYGRAWLIFSLAKLLPLKRRQVLVLSDSRAVLSGNLEFIVRELTATHPEFTVRTVLRANLSAQRHWRDAIRLPYLIATSKFIVVDDFIPYVYRLTMREGAHLIQAWHAAGAFKRVGYSRRGLPGGPAEDSITHRGYTDAIVSSERIRRDYAEAFWMPIEGVHALGVPRTDVFFDPDHAAAARARVRAQYGIRDEQRVVLYAPTFRGNGQRVAYFDPAIIDWDALAAAFGDHTVLLVKMHPFVREAPDIYSDRPQFVDVSAEREINELLFAADALVTDYSSVIFEYALLRRPIVFHVPDLEDYQGARDFYYPFERYLAGPVTRTTAELIEALARPELDTAALDRFVADFMAACDGRSSERFVERLIVARADEPASARPTPVWPPSALPGQPGAPIPRPSTVQRALARLGRAIRRERQPGLVSTIVPAYNVESYIEEAVRSVLDQSHRRLEVIVVDDSSTDGTPAILKRLAKEDRRLRVYRRPNGGVNRARNYGLHRAKGQYLTFLDSDDVLLPGAYAEMVASLKRSGSDFVVGSYERIRDGELEPPRVWITNAHNKDREHFTVRGYPRVLVNAVQWSKMYVRSFWDDYVKTFPEPGFYQDQVVSAKAYGSARHIDMLQRPVVGWRLREDRSSMTQQLGTVANLRDRFSTAREAVRILRERAGDAVADTRLLQLLRFDFGTTTGRLVDADDAYWAQLRSGIREFAAMARERGVWEEISAQHRILFFLIEEDRRADAVEFTERGGREPADFPMEVVGDDLWIHLPLWERDDVPRELFRASPIQRDQYLPTPDAAEE